MAGLTQEITEAIKGLANKMIESSNGQEMPLTGNLFVFTEYLKTLMNKEYMVFRLYEQERMYFSNLWKLKTNNKLLKRYFHRIVGLCFDYGSCAVRIKDNKLEAYGCTNLNCDATGDVVSARIFTTNILVGSAITMQTKLKNYSLITNDKWIFFRWGQLAISAWFQLIIYLGMRVEIIKIMGSNIPATQLKIIGKTTTGDPKVIADEIDKAYFNTSKNSVVINVDNLKNAKGGQDSIYSEKGGYKKGQGLLGADAKIDFLVMPNAPNENTFSDWEKITTMQYSAMGHMTNLSTKKERNVSSEVGFNVTHFETIQDEYKNEFEISLDMLREKFFPDDEEYVIEIAHSVREIIQNSSIPITNK